MWTWKKPPPVSRRKQGDAGRVIVRNPRAKQILSAKERLLRGSVLFRSFSLLFSRFYLLEMLICKDF